MSSGEEDLVAAAHSTKASIVAALAANTFITITKFAAAFLTGSSAMLSEGFHSLVDTGNEALLLYGQYRANRPPDEEHPLGYGRELYFWSFVVAVLIFAAGAGLSLYEGVQHILEPRPIRDPVVNYVVLAITFVADGLSWRIAFRNFRSKNADIGLWRAVVRSKDPAALAVLFEDSADMLGVVIAFTGIFASVAFDMPILDGIASVGIALLLAAVATLLARESKGLLIGEPANSAVVVRIRRLAEENGMVRRVPDIFTLHLGPDEIVTALSIDFDTSGSAADVQRAVGDIETRIKKALPGISAVFFLPLRSETASAMRRSSEPK